jgi:glycine/D-amino acid oxidase-like deaminating enzyme/nitrite reductase/ring-hydroxylating ferredoxin subunit
MKRDGALTSLWQTTVPDLIINDSIDTGTIYDVVIVGGGITGIATALELQKKGKRVLIAEAQNIGFGTTGGTTAHINNFFETPYSQLISDFGEDDTRLAAKMVQKAMGLIESNIREYNIDCGFKKVPGYLFALNEDQVKDLDEFYEGFEKVGIGVSASNSIPVKIPFVKAIEVPGQAYFHPTRYIHALAEAFIRGGGVILQQCRVTGVDEATQLKIETTKGTLQAHNLVYATHVPPGVNLLHFRCAPYRSYAMAFTLKNDEDYPTAMAYDMDDPYRYYRTQEIDGRKYFIAGGEDHKTAHEENTEGCFKRLEAYVRNFYEIDEVVYKWSSQYFDPTDGLAYIGTLPGHADNMFVATGYGGIGMTNSHIAAILISDLITTGKTEAAELFDPNRIKPVAGFNNFVKEAADVVQHLVGAVLPKEKLTELSDMAPGEAKVVRYEGHTLALYKDEQGKLHTVNSACTHIKCTVAWNSAEKSWDCPCHGSRFSPDGEMLTAPARKDLEVINL